MMSDQTQSENTPWHDPVVQELHDVRDQLVQKYHGDMSAYSQAAKAHALALGFRFGLQAQVDPAAFQVVLAKVPQRSPLAGDE